jgi:adenylate cyclase
MHPTMNSSASSSAWLEAADGQSIPVSGICSLGRSRNNQVVLKDTKASRRHAMIHPQGEGEYWLVDFGSTNGTLVNGRRVIQPTTLADGDEILLASETYVFRKSTDAASDTAAFDSSFTSAVTASEIRSISCWMLITDIEDSTRLSQTCPGEQLPVVLGRWFLSCKETIDECNGQINKFLGDGFFAYWTDHPTAAAHVGNALRKLTEAQKASQPPFRWVLHFGPVSVGGSTSLGEESLLGPEVNFAFRMEKLAGKLGLHRMLSEAARGKLDLGLEPEKVGPHELSGFDGGFFFHTY